MSGAGHRIGRQLSRTIVMLVILQVMTSVGGAWLLGRMSPAIARILDENERSVESVEEMLLALGSEDDDTLRRARFDDALSRAEANITEPDEPAVLATLRAQLDPAIAGDAAARREVLSGLAHLAEINRNAMHRADAEAQRLGLAGAWAVSLLGILGLLASIYTAQRMRRRFVGPLELLAEVVDDHARGMSHRRCPRTDEGELGDVLQQVNGILDRLEGGAGRSSAEPTDVALQRLLDHRGVIALLGADGRVIAASQPALDRFAEAPDLRKTLVTAAEEGSDVEGMRFEALPNGSWLAEWASEPEDAARAS